MTEQTVTLQPGESRVVSFEATPHEAKTYQVSVDGLSGSFRALAVPNIKLTNLTWDATPPFDAGSRHVWTLRMRNLSAGGFTYQLWVSMNGKRFMGYTAKLGAGEVREISYPYTFGAEGSYTLSIEAYYNEQLLDEISSTVIVEVPPAPPVIDGWIVGGLVWTGEPLGWLSITYPSVNEWPTKELLVRVAVQNTGNVRANFEVRLGMKKGSAYLEPGAQRNIEFYYTPSLMPVEENYDLYGNGSLLEHHRIKISGY